MPRSLVHDIEGPEDERLWDALVEQVAHGVDEHSLRLPPLQGKREEVLVDGNLETVEVIGLPHRLEAPRHPLCVAVSAASADLRAAGDRVPRRRRPLDRGVFRH